MQTYTSKPARHDGVNDSASCSESSCSYMIAAVIEAQVAALERVCSMYPTPDFSGLGGGKAMPSPVEITRSEEGLSERRTLIANQYKKLGFALIQNSEGVVRPEALPQFAERLGLGDIYVPPYFNLMQGAPSVSSAGVAVISSIGQCGKVMHNSFQTNKAEGLHVDGTIAQIGEVRTTFLLCNSPAAEGGESLLFNAVGACLHLSRKDPGLVAPLFHPLAMKRGKIDSGGTRVGPVFGLVNGELVTRFSINETTDWHYGFQRVPGLKRAYEALVECTRGQSPFMLKFRLAKGVGLVIANDKISHGRLSFIDSADCVRSMARTLHRGRPK